MPEDNQSEKMDSESLRFLEDVRKGKLRNFVMSVKGAKVRSLLIKKKKIKPDEIKSARGSGFQPMFGVTSGQAANVTFFIAKSDGFEDDPLGGKVQKLKEFLKEQTGKAFKPTVEVVDTPPPIPFDEADLNDPLIARFMSLAGAIDQACERDPEQSESLRRKVSEIRELLQDPEARPEAETPINELENLLGNLVEQNDSATEESQPSDPDKELAVKLAKLLTKLKPMMAQAVEKDPSQKDELQNNLAQIVTKIKTGDLDAAKLEVSQYAARLKAILGGASATPELDLSRWTSERNNAMAELKSVAKTIAEEKHPQSKDAIIEIKAVLANLTESPSNLNQIGELEKYLAEDQVVADVCELANDIRAPLMDALAGIKSQLQN